MSKALTGDTESRSLSVSGKYTLWIHAVGAPLASLYPGPDGLTAENR